MLLYSSFLNPLLRMLSPPGSHEEKNNDETAERKEEDWVLAKRGVILVLNNRFNEAYECFKGRGESIQLAAGHCYVTFLVCKF